MLRSPRPMRSVQWDFSRLQTQSCSGPRICRENGSDTNQVRRYRQSFTRSSQQTALRKVMEIVESDHALPDLRGGKIDVLIGHLDVEGHASENGNVPYRSLSPDSFRGHAMGPVYFANERAFSWPGNLEKFLIAIANGWNATYSDYDRTVPILARFIDDKLSSVQISHFMGAQRRFLRPHGARFGELDPKHLNNLQGQLLQQRIMRQSIDLARAANYDILTEVHRTKSDMFSRIEP
jgi:putative hydroxymethylpyrimidine transport system substrate-binding protein